MFKNKITFYSLIPGLAESYPIVPATSFRPKWLEEAKKDCVSKTKELIIKDFAHVHHCPGIHEILKEGFIVPMWHDLLIETNGDRKSYRYQIPTDALESFMSDVPLLSHHDAPAKFIPFPENSMKIILKLNTPWRVICPKDIKLLIMPLSYPDEHIFSSVTGILDCGFSNEINIQLFWHALNDRILLKSGTPMMQIIPLTEKKYEMICRFRNEWDVFWNLKKKFISSSSWIFKRHISKKAYCDHYKL